MAKIPRLKTRPVSRTAVLTPTANPRSAGQGFKNLNKAAGMATNFLLDLRHKRKVAETNDSNRTNTLEFSKSANEKETESKLKFSGDHKGYTDSISDHLDGVEKDLLDSAPNEEARKEQKFRFQKLKLDYLQSADAYENNQRAKNYVKNQANVVQETSLRYLDNPNPLLAMKEMPMTLSDLGREAGVTVTKEQTIELQQNYIEGTRKSLVQGMLNKGMYAQAEEVMTGDQFKELRQGMEVGEAHKFQTVIKGLRDKEEKARIAAITKRGTNITAVLTSGRGTDPRFAEQIKSFSQEIDSLPDGKEKSLLRENFEHGKIAADAADVTKHLSLSDLEKVKDIHDIVKTDNIDTAINDIKLVNFVKRSMASNLKAREADSSQYLEDTYPMLKGPENSEARIAKAKELGIINIRGISKAESSRQIKYLDESVSPIDKASRLDEIVNSYGSGARQAMADMTKDGLDPGFMAATQFDDPMARSKTISNLINKKAINENFSKQFPGDNSKNVTKAVQDINSNLSKSWMSAFGDSSSSKMVQSMNEMVELETKLIMTKEGLGATEAAEKAFNNTVGSQWDTATLSAQGNTEHTALIPKGMDKRPIEAFFKHYSTPGGMEVIGVDHHRYIDFLGTKEEFSNMVSESSNFVTNETQDGVYLRRVDRAGVSAFMVTREGDKIEIKYADMGTSKYPLVNDELNSILISPEEIKTARQKELKDRFNLPARLR